jgi:4-hydroxy-tetrahydrodipicolinate reductase
LAVIATIPVGLTGIAWGGKAIRIPVMDSVTKAVRHAGALADYTSHEAVRANVLAAIQGGVAAGNFSITAAIAQAASLLVAPYLPHGEVIDYASAAKWSPPKVRRVTSRQVAYAVAQTPGVRELGWCVVNSTSATFLARRWCRVHDARDR